MSPPSPRRRVRPLPFSFSFLLFYFAFRLSLRLRVLSFPPPDFRHLISDVCSLQIISRGVELPQFELSIFQTTLLPDGNDLGLQRRLENIDSGLQVKQAKDVAEMKESVLKGDADALLITNPREYPPETLTKACPDLRRQGIPRNFIIDTLIDFAEGNTLTRLQPTLFVLETPNGKGKEEGKRVKGILGKGSRGETGKGLVKEAPSTNLSTKPSELTFFARLIRIMLESAAVDLSY